MSHSKSENTHLTPGFIKHSMYALVRLAPIVSGVLFIDLSSLLPDEYATVINRLIRLAAVLIAWSICEGVSMLWIKHKNLGATNSRGYGILTILLSLITLAFLELFRGYSTQSQFFVLLTALALRGMTRGGWEQNRPQIAVGTSIGAHTFASVLSFMSLMIPLKWPVLVISLSVGGLVGALEAAWHSQRLQNQYSRWIPPVHRLSITLAPIAIGTLSIAHQLPTSYTSLFLLLLLAIPIARRSTHGDLIATGRFMAVFGLYLLFLMLLLACRVYS
jgi:hypothetical protein